MAEREGFDPSPAGLESAVLAIDTYALQFGPLHLFSRKEACDLVDECVRQLRPTHRIKFGSSGGIRTHTGLVLSQVSLPVGVRSHNWRTYQDSNLGQPWLTARCSDH